ncbi:MAG: hypothetical protein ACR2KK_21955 [Acidimicrobiales bacterium]
MTDQPWGDDEPTASVGPAALELDGLRRLLVAEHQLVEVLGTEEYAWVHLPGAINVPLDRIGSIVEPVFGQDRHPQTPRRQTRLITRQQSSRMGAFIFMAACHNIRKLFGFTDIASMATG